MEKVIARQSFEEGEDEQLEYWASLSPKERFGQAKIWNDKIWKFITQGESELGMDKTVGGFVKKSQADEDDF